MSGALAAMPAVGREVTGDFDRACAREWLVTNGTGSFASGTIAGCNTRRYHGLLITALNPPVDRVVMVAALDASVDYQGRRYALDSHLFADGTVHPRGYLNIESFVLEHGVPTWRFAFSDALLEKKIFMPHQRDISYVMFRCVRASAPISLSVRPLCTYRDYHHESRGRRGFVAQALDGGVRILAHTGARPYTLAADGSRFDAAEDWYWNFEHRVERERGLDSVEDLFCPGAFELRMEPGSVTAVVASAETDRAPDVRSALEAVEARTRDLERPLSRHAPAWIAQLALAADQFVVRRGESGTTVIAGYPWFTDWGRDTMIALPGLTSAVGRSEVAATILRTFARHVDRGMLPNRFPDHGEEAEYNTVDATLWFFEASADFLRHTADVSFARELYPVLVSIIRTHLSGTRYEIAVDSSDGLLRAGTAGVQLTWMDAKIGDWVVTPRTGKPVEINALWLNALHVTLGLAEQLEDREGQALCCGLLRQASSSFQKFWSPEHGYLYDVIDGDGDVDASLRPNQLFAVSLPYSALDASQMRSVVDACGRELLTSYGLRSLASSDDRYVGRYEGDQFHRDGAYHQGTVWPWLLGPFALAHYRVHGDARLAQSLLAPMAEHLGVACIGSISEITDGDAPHTPRGCIAQAWSVAELLKAWTVLEQAASTSETRRASA